jgi:PPOX class probable F420-dependent enzyme
MNPLAMTKEEREAFLAEAHVGVLCVARSGMGPLAVPVWYGYEPGADVRIVTADSAPKTRLIRAAGRISLCVQTETLPYKYLTIEGPVTIGTPDFERDVRGIAHRYLGPVMGDRYVAATEKNRRESPEVVIRIRPERWRSEDFSKFSMEA